MSRNLYDFERDTPRTPPQKTQSGARKVRRAPQSTSAPQSKDLIAAQKAAKKANAEKVAKQMEAKRAAQRETQPTAAPHKNIAASTAKSAMQKTGRKANAVPSVGQSVAKHLPAKKGGRKRSQQKEPRVGVGSAREKDPNHAPLYNIEEDMPRKQMPPKKQKRHKEAPVLTRKAVRRRKAIRNLVAGLLMLILVVVGIGYSINLLFRVKSIELQTPDGQVPADTGIYTEEIILAKLDIALDDHFLSFSTDAQEALLQEALPLLENIEVIRDYPDGVIIRLEPAVETYTMEIADGWLILSGEMHVMDTVTQQPSLLVLSGATPSTYVAGQSLAFVQTLEDDWYEGQTETDIEVLQSLASQEMQTRSDAQVEALQSLIESLEQAELLADITELTFDGEDGITFYYQDRITVLIGTTNSLEYKLSLAQYILWNENGDGCAETDTGVLDVSYQSADGTITTTFAQG